MHLTDVLIPFDGIIEEVIISILIISKYNKSSMEDELKGKLKNKLKDGLLVYMTSMLYSDHASYELYFIRISMFIN